MSTNNLIREESLREAACIGDFENVERFIQQGVNVNSQNVVNGWTALHWAAKRGHKQIAKLLLENGATNDIKNYKDETAIDVAINNDIIQLLGGEVSPVNTPSTSSNNDFIPNYISNPPLNVKLNEKRIKVNENGRRLNNKEIIIKLRIANISDPDFIEVELFEPTLGCLIHTACQELEIDPAKIFRIRKLPNTIVRNDKDVERFTYLQEIEIVMPTKLEDSSSSNNSITKSTANSYQSISKYKDQTILY